MFSTVKTKLLRRRATGGGGGEGSIHCPKSQYGNMCPQKHPKENNVLVFIGNRIPRVKDDIFI